MMRRLWHLTLLVLSELPPTAAAGGQDFPQLVLFQPGNKHSIVKSAE